MSVSALQIGDFRSMPINYLESISGTPEQLSALLKSQNNPFYPFDSVVISEDDDSESGEAFYAVPCIPNDQVAFEVGLGDGVICITNVKPTEHEGVYKILDSSYPVFYAGHLTLESLYDELKRNNFMELSRSFPTVEHHRKVKAAIEKEIEEFFLCIAGGESIMDDLSLSKKIEALYTSVRENFMIHPFEHKEARDNYEMAKYLFGKLAPDSYRLVASTYTKSKRSHRVVGMVQNVVLRILEQEAQTVEWKKHFGPHNALNAAERQILLDVAEAIQADPTGEVLGAVRAVTNFDFGTNDAYEALEMVNISPQLKAKIKAILDAESESEVAHLWS